MPTTTDVFPPETIARARALYADPAVPVSRILAETGMSKSNLYYALDGAGGSLPALPRRFRSPGARRRALSGDRVSLVKRLWRTAERQVRDIEDRLLRNQQAPDDMRTMATLVKTLRELSVLGESMSDARDKDIPDDDGPRDIDEFRRDLARRMDAFVADRTGGGVPGK